MKKYQVGVGLVEILVSLVLLAIAVLGFSALQLRAVVASMDAGNNVQATTLARDLAERIRINRAGFSEFSQSNTAYSGVSNTTECLNTACTPQQLAQFDFAQVKRKATDLGMSISIQDCQGISLKRKCIYVAWDDTTATDGNGMSQSNENKRHCTNGTTYVANAQCIIMEIYNYD